MLRFIDLSTEYWTDPACGHPVCAFLSTSDNNFVVNEDGNNVFGSMEEILECHRYADRMIALMPDGFFERRWSEWSNKWQLPGLPACWRY